MSTIAIGIIVAIIIVILVGVFFFLKNRNSEDYSQASIANRPRTLAEQNLTPQYPNHPAQSLPTSTADDDLMTAQHYINQQDFVNAQKVLTQSIRNNPSRSDVYFMLLNTFALSKDYNNFYKFYPTVIALNHPIATSQATYLKKMVDDELARSQASSTPAAQNIPTPLVTEDQAFNTNENAFAQPTTQQFAPTNSVAAEPEVDFDFDVSETAPVQTNIPSPTNEIEPESTVNFDFDVSETEQIPTIPTPVNTIEPEPTVDFDFDVDETTPVQAATSMPAQTIEPEPTVDFDFDVSEATPNTESISAPVVTAPAPTPVAAPEVEMDFDFGMDETPATPVVETPAPVVTPAPTPVATPEAEMDFDFGMDSMAETPATPVVEAPAPVVTPAPTPVAAPEAEMDFDFGMDSMAETPATPVVETPAPVVTPAPTPVATAEAEMDFDFGMDSMAETPATPVVAAPVVAAPVIETPVVEIPTSVEPTSIDIETAVPAAPEVEVKTAAPTVTLSSVDTDSNFDIPAENVVPAAPQVEIVSTSPVVLLSDDDNAVITTDEPGFVANPTASIPSLTSDLENVQNVDSTLLNIELAEQYIELGEYDSAKRLLDEVQATASTSYAEKIQTLLEKIG